MAEKKITIHAPEETRIRILEEMEPLNDTDTSITVKGNPIQLFTLLETQNLETKSIEIEDFDSESEFPIKGNLYFHNEGADAVASHRDFREIDYDTDAYEGLKNFMYEVEVGVKLYKDGTVEPQTFNGRPIGEMSEE